MGEIGISRLEYLYELRYWEILLITRGYFRRHHPGWEQARLIAYNAHYCMGSKDPVPNVTDWMPFPWEHKDAKPVSQEDIDDLQAEMAAMNAQLSKP